MGFFIHLLYAQNSKYVRISTFWETEVKRKNIFNNFSSFVFLKHFSYNWADLQAYYLNVSQSLYASKGSALHYL